MNDPIEQEIQAKGLNAPRVTPADLDAQVLAEQFHVFPGTTLTVCCITMLNGFTVLGESACADPANFDRDLGEKIARNSAKLKMWPLLGYALRSELTERGPGAKA
jgi:hypothetical protein